jgi:cytochrome c-type biogenesis protein CcmH/NrfG
MTELQQTQESDSEPRASASAWKGQHAYLMASVCLVLGLAVGYFLRGSQAPAPAAVTVATPPPAVPADMPSPEQVKHMGDKMAEPILAALQKNPDDPDLLAKAASIYFRSAQFPLAAEYYERSVKIKPTAEGYVSLSNAYHYAENNEKAFEALNRALQIDPKSANALFNLGMLDWRVKNDPKGAIEVWQRLLKLNPNHPRRAQVEMMIAKAKQHMDMPATN